jgi:hypothetical protein
MDSLNSIGYTPEELFSQKGGASEDAKFDKTLMADLSRQARWPMRVVLADKYPYDHSVHHMPPDNDISSTNWIWRVKNILWRKEVHAIYDGPRPRQ